MRCKRFRRRYGAISRNVSRKAAIEPGYKIKIKIDLARDWTGYDADETNSGFAVWGPGKPRATFSHCLTAESDGKQGRSEAGTQEQVRRENGISTRCVHPV